LSMYGAYSNDESRHGQLNYIPGRTSRSARLGVGNNSSSCNQETFQLQFYVNLTGARGGQTRSLPNLVCDFLTRYNAVCNIPHPPTCKRSHFGSDHTFNLNVLIAIFLFYNCYLLIGCSSWNKWFPL